VHSVSYVAISGPVVEKVVREAREHPDEQVVGVLLGGQSGETIVIEDAATGPAESDGTKATLTGESIARIADDIINKRIRGSIVGWYHSHVRGGVFMSETDVETQLKLQQFSPLVAAMVIDAQTGASGFFRADPKTKEVVSVSSQNLSTEIAAPAPPPYAPERAMYPQAPVPMSQGPSTRTLLLALIIITLAVTGGIVALAYYRSPGVYGGNLAITHTSPNGPFAIANPITFDANVTGTDLLNVTLAYRIIEMASSGKGLIVGDLIKVPMLLRAAGGNTYSYTVPSSEISGVYVQYYISAYDGSGNVVRTEVYNLSVGDFIWSNDKTDEVVVIRQMTSQVSLPLETINGFSKLVTLRVVGSAPAGVSVRPVASQVIPPNPGVLQISSTSDAQLVQKYEMEIDAVYSPAGASAVQIVRTTTLVLTITDFDFDISPTYMESGRGTDVYVSYTLTLRVYDGFVATNNFQFSVTGLPDHTSWQLILVSYKIDNTGLATSVYSLQVKVESNAPTGLFLFNVNISAATSGGTVSHDPTTTPIQLKIS
jgi:proteasome lid subunit RPN8/RPN11